MLSLKEIKNLIKKEELVDQSFLHLTANETLISPFAQEVLSSPLYNRYLLEHLDMRFDSPSRLNGFLFRGLNNVNKIEKSATEVCKKLFGADFVEFRCLSGLHAMQTTLVSLTEPGDTIMRVSTKDGGHFATQHLIKLFGRNSCCYVFDKKTRQIDLEKTKKVIEKERPSLLYIDAMNYLFPFPFKELKKIIGDVPLIFDASHTLGLIAGGEFQNPLVEGVDILQANTHKTFFGPQKGIILSNNRRLIDKISYNLTNALVSSQHTSSSLALFISLHESLLFGKEYAKKIIENAQHLAKRLHEKGLKILCSDQGFTKNHQFFIDVTELGSGQGFLEKLLDAHISVNRTSPFEHVDAIRIGLQEITRRGFSIEDLDQIAEWISQIILKNRDPNEVSKEVIQLVNSRRNILFCGDDVKNEKPIINSIPAEKTKKQRWVDFKQIEKSTVLNSALLQDVQELAQLACHFDQQTDGSGNISIRNGGRIFVTISGSYLNNLQESDFAEITDVDKFTVKYKGISSPSSESLMHFLIYKLTDANIVVHNHYLPTDEEIKENNIAVLPPLEYASIQLAEAVASKCKNSKIVFVQKHGLIFHSKTKEECLSLLEKFSKKLLVKVLQHKYSNKNNLIKSLFILH